MTRKNKDESVSVGAVGSDKVPESVSEDFSAGSLPDIPSSKTVQRSTDTTAPVPPPNRFKRLLHVYWRRKFLTIPLTILLIVGTVLALPATRYTVLGLFMESDFTVVVLDEKSKKPVTKAQVQLGTGVAQTDAKGQVKLRASVGTQKLSVIKKYYKPSNADVLVTTKQKNGPFRIFVRATGRQVPVTVTNKITGKAVAGVTLAAAGSEVKTDKDGKAVIVLSDAGILTEPSGFVPWNDIYDEHVALKNGITRQRSSQWFLAFSHPGGHVAVYLENLAIGIPQLDLLLWIYRGRFESGTDATAGVEMTRLT